MFRLIVLATLVLVPDSRVAAADTEPTFRHEALQKLLKDLKDKDVQVRRLAATTLGMPDGSEGKGGPRPRGDLWPAMLALVEVQQDPDMQVRANAMRSLGLLMRFRGVVEKLDDRFEKVALAAIAALKDPEDLVKTAASEALPLIVIETEKSVAALQEVLKDGQPRVRAAAATGARGVRPISKIVEALAERVADSDASVRLAAITSLNFARADGAAAVKPLIAALNDPMDTIANAAANTLGSIGPSAGPAVFALTEVIADRARVNRTAAIDALGRIATEAQTAIPALIGALTEEATREPALRALAMFTTHGRPAIPAIAAFARDASGSVRPAALMALAEIDVESPEFVELLLAGLYDRKPAAREAAIRECFRGFSENASQVLPELIVLFRVDPASRLPIANVFRNMGPAAKPALPLLMELIGDLQTNANLRRVLVNAVNRIDPDLLRPPGK